MFWFLFLISTVALLGWAFISAVKKQNRKEDEIILQNAIEEQPIILNEQPSEMQLKVQEMNEKLPLHSMWDGFWIHEFYNNNELTISCSFDRIYYRNFDFIFDGTIFFNVPIEWRDTNIDSDNLLRLATEDEFKQQQPDFDTKNLHIFAIDIVFYFKEAPELHTFYIVAQSVKMIDCTTITGANAAPGSMYDDPYPQDTIYSKRNKMP